MARGDPILISKVVPRKSRFKISTTSDKRLFTSSMHPYLAHRKWKNTANRFYNFRDLFFQEHCILKPLGQKKDWSFNEVFSARCYLFQDMGSLFAKDATTNALFTACDCLFAANLHHLCESHIGQIQCFICVWIIYRKQNLECITSLNSTKIDSLIWRLSVIWRRNSDRKKHYIHLVHQI